MGLPRELTFKAELRDRLQTQNDAIKRGEEQIRNMRQSLLFMHDIAFDALGIAIEDRDKYEVTDSGIKLKPKKEVETPNNGVQEPVEN